GSNARSTTRRSPRPSWSAPRSPATASREMGARPGLLSPCPRRAPGYPGRTAISRRTLRCFGRGGGWGHPGRRAPAAPRPLDRSRPQRAGVGRQLLAAELWGTLLQHGAHALARVGALARAGGHGVEVSVLDAVARGDRALDDGLHAGQREGGVV